MKRYKIVNNAMGWMMFLIAAFVYCSTIEPTASFWDCPEFIASGYKMEIGHPPGAPFFMLTANLFSHFAGDVSQVARMVNTMSALLSATCIMFLFWTITHLTRKLIMKDGATLTTRKLIAIEGSGMTGALIYTFSDTFWFSAVEGEVYAYSSAFTAVVFWLILKWEEHADEPHSDRWLVLIFYMTGLSIGVHLLNLLCIPAIVLVFVYRKFPDVELRGSLIALAISFVLVAAVLYGLVPGIITVGGWFELLFVNVLGCPFNTGLAVYTTLLVATVVWAIRESYIDRSMRRENISFVLSVAMLGIPFHGYGWSAACIGIIILVALWILLNRKTGKQRVPVVSARIKNTAMLCMLMLIIGYSTYAVIMIRSTANPPMNENSPKDIFTLGSYLSREQYGDKPLLYGQTYTSQVKLKQQGNMCVPVSNEGAPVWQRGDETADNGRDRYVVASHKTDYVYAQNMVFPRMWDQRHADDYESWMGGVDGTNVAYDRCGETINVKVPTQWENIRFFLSYQCNFMYWRYFMWNFAGRQNDIQGKGEAEHGNWITGFEWIDNHVLRLGDQSSMPDELKQNKGHNVFYCMPLMLGLIGMLWQAFHGRRGIRQFWVICFLFFMTGLAIIVYLNQTPSEPRERDYAYVGSFYAFAIWCGMGVAAIIDMAKRYMHGTVTAAAVAALCLIVPIQMASQTWDDHDRSNRYMCRDFGRNYLMSVQDSGKPIILNNGDNETFPLWYDQDVEGVRTDVRACNLNFIQAGWYIDQMRRQAYSSPALPIPWQQSEYCEGTNDIVEIEPQIKQQVLDFYRQNPAQARAQFGDQPFELKNILKYWVRSKDPDQHVIPTDTLYITIDKEAVRRSGMMMADDTIPDKMVISLAGKRALYKGDLMLLQILANANWTRPIYVASTMDTSLYFNLGDNMVTEGLAMRITPFNTSKPWVKNFDTKKVYDNVMYRFRYGGLSRPGLYLDKTVMGLCYEHRQLIAKLALNLITERQPAKASKALAKAEREIPTYNVPMTYLSGGADMARAYALLGQHAKARETINAVWTNAEQYARWYLSLDGTRFAQSRNDCMMQLSIMYKTIQISAMIDRQMAAQQTRQLNELYAMYQGK